MCQSWTAALSTRAVSSRWPSGLYLMGHAAARAAPEMIDHGRTGYLCRSEDEMTAAAQFLDELAVPSRVASASAQWLAQLLAEQSPGQPSQ